MDRVLTKCFGKDNRIAGEDRVEARAHEDFVVTSAVSFDRIFCVGRVFVWRSGQLVRAKRARSCPGRCQLHEIDPNFTRSARRLDGGKA